MPETRNQLDEKMMQVRAVVNAERCSTGPVLPIVSRRSKPLIGRSAKGPEHE
jgi:hypothetical protein